jgi:hypothetical protein
MVFSPCKAKEITLIAALPQWQFMPQCSETAALLL